LRCSRFASNLSLGWQPSQRPQGDSPGSRQRPFGLGNFRPIRRVMDSPCLSAGGIRFLNLRVPAGELGLASEDRLAYRACARTTTGLPRSAPVRHDRGGCCLYSGAVVSVLEPVRRSSPFWPVNRLANHLIGDPTLRSLLGSLLAFTRPIFPLPGSPVWFGSALGFTPLLSHASLPGACRGQGQDWTLSRAVTTSHVYSIWFRAASR